MISEERPLNPAENDLFRSLKCEDLEVQRRLESLWHQKSRVKWHLQGDRNTKYFHSLASAHFRNNYISSLGIRDSMFLQPEEIKPQARNYFVGLFKRLDSVPFSLQGLSFLSLPDSQAASLINPFSEAEIHEALMGCGSSKAPRPDELNFYFYKCAWRVFKSDLISMFTDLHNFGKLPKGLNSAFLVLVPKVAGTSSLSEFRPISLIHGLYKLLAKVLSFRLRSVLPTVIAENQQAFLKGRNISDCSMVANEIIRILSVRKERAFMLKIDFQKAFDSISWV